MASKGRLSHSYVRGTASILQPQLLQFSPVFGLLAKITPAYASNMRIFPQADDHARNVAAELFHQRVNKDGIRYGPGEIL